MTRRFLIAVAIFAWGGFLLSWLALPAGASRAVSTRGLKALDKTVSAGGLFGIPPYTTAALPACTALLAQSAPVAWDTTVAVVKLCDGTAWVTTAFTTSTPTFTSLTISGLTSGRVVTVGTAGLLQDSASLTFDATNLTTTRHFKVTSTAPAVSACGTSPSIAGSDTAGKVTAGTGAVTTCTLTFATAYGVAPACYSNNETTAQVMRAVSTTTTLVIDGADFTSDVISYMCVQGS